MDFILNKKYLFKVVTEATRFFSYLGLVLEQDDTFVKIKDKFGEIVWIAKKNIAEAREVKS